MGYEKGGRADKAGNRFENNWVLCGGRICHL